MALKQKPPVDHGDDDGLAEESGNFQPNDIKSQSINTGELKSDEDDKKEELPIESKNAVKAVDTADKSTSGQNISNPEYDTKVCLLF